MIIYNFVKKHNISKTLFVTYFVFFALIFYFLSCALFGAKGLTTYFDLRSQMSAQDMTRQELSSQLQIKKNMVEGMNVDSLDLDLLDEEARRSLGYSNKNEVVIYHQNDNIIKKEQKNVE